MIVLHAIVIGLIGLVCAFSGNEALVILLTPFTVAAICTVPRRLSPSARVAIYLVTAVCCRVICYAHAAFDDPFRESLGWQDGVCVQWRGMAPISLYLALELVTLTLCVAHLRQCGISDRWALVYAILPAAHLLNGVNATSTAWMALALLLFSRIVTMVPPVLRVFTPRRQAMTIGVLVFFVAAFSMSPTGRGMALWPVVVALISMRGRVSLAWLLLIPAMAWQSQMWSHTSNSTWTLWAIFVSVLLWALPLALLAIQGRRYLRAARAKAGVSAAETVSIVIPTLNEALGIEHCVRAALRDACVCEVLVVDGGSDDDTTQIAERAGARVVRHDGSCGAGRGGHIRAGVLAARGDVAMILHADTLLTAGSADEVVRFLQQRPGIAGGALGSQFDGTKCVLRWVEAANDLRAAFLGISFGDQVQFVRRDVALARDLIPAIPLMEDVELSLRMNAVGPGAYLFGSACVSARAWNGAAGKRAWLVIALVFRFLWERTWGTPDVEAMYRRYYGSATRR